MASVLVLGGGGREVKAAPPFDGPVEVMPLFPAEVGVGDLLVPATLTLTSSALLPVSIIEITVDTGDLQLSPAGFGTGAACPGATFLAVPSGRPGSSSLLPSYPIVLPPFNAQIQATCTIQLTFNVLRMPVDPDVRVTGQIKGSAIPGVVISASGTVTTRVRRSSVAVVVTARSATATQDRPIRAIATVVSGPSSPLVPPPTGTVSFALFGPDDAECRGTPLQTSAEQPVGIGPIRSPAFRPSVTGTHRWVARYSGDFAHAAASSPCDAPTVVIDPSGAPAAAPFPTATTTTAVAPPAPTPPPAPVPAPAATPAPTTAGAAAPQPRRRTGTRADLAAYQPAAHAEEVVALQVSAFALLALAGAAGARASAGSAPAADEAREAGEVGFTEIESADEGIAAASGTATSLRPGDRSWTWRSPGTSGLDRISRHGPAAVAARSPLLARVLNDDAPMVVKGQFRRLGRGAWQDRDEPLLAEGKLLLGHGIR